jgi:hypothetical protein
MAGANHRHLGTQASDTPYCVRFCRLVARFEVRAHVAHNAHALDPVGPDRGDCTLKNRLIAIAPTVRQEDNRMWDGSPEPSGRLRRAVPHQGALAMVALAQIRQKVSPHTCVGAEDHDGVVAVRWQPAVARCIP